MVTRHIRKQTSSGFTLVELLVALTILSMVLTLLGSSVRFGARVAETVESRIALNQEIYLVQRMLRRQLQQALPALGRNGNMQRGLDFKAASDRIEFLAPAVSRAIRPGTYRFTLRIDQPATGQGIGKTLVMTYVREGFELDENSGTAEPQEVVILSGFASGEFSYLGVTGRSGANWLPEWSHTSSLPGLIRLRIRYPAAARSVWTDLIVAPKITALAGASDG